MPVSRRLTAALLLGALAAPAFAPAGLAADPPPDRVCLNKAEQRAAVAAHKAIPLVQAVKILRQHRHRVDMVGARLCRRGDTLVYVLTLLSRSGKVTRVIVDAANGEVINGR